MNKNKQFLGIDISKDVFDVVDHQDHHHQYSNNQSGFKEFHKILTQQSHCVMEVTGSYYQGLANWLHSKYIDVSVVNPLSVKRFIQMRNGPRPDRLINQNPRRDSRVFLWPIANQACLGEQYDMNKPGA